MTGYLTDPRHLYFTNRRKPHTPGIALRPLPLYELKLTSDHAIRLINKACSELRCQPTDLTVCIVSGPVTLPIEYGREVAPLKRRMMYGPPIKYDGAITL